MATCLIPMSSSFWPAVIRSNDGSDSQGFFVDIDTCDTSFDEFRGKGSSLPRQVDFTRLGLGVNMDVGMSRAGGEGV